MNDLITVPLSTQVLEVENYLSHLLNIDRNSIVISVKKNDNNHTTSFNCYSCMTVREINEEKWMCVQGIRMMETVK